MDPAYWILGSIVGSAVITLTALAVSRADVRVIDLFSVYGEPLFRPSKYFRRPFNRVLPVAAIMSAAAFWLGWALLILAGNAPVHYLLHQLRLASRPG